MINNATVLATGLHLIGKIPEREACRALLMSRTPPDDGNQLVDWLMGRFPGLKASYDSSLWQRALDLIEKNKRVGVQVIGIASHEYPKFLRMIDDPPPIIFVKGNLNTLGIDTTVAIVGTRDATPKGLEVAKRIAIHLGEAGWLSVSGLALGIDAAAHGGSLLAGSKTIAVLAHGLEQASPRKNAKLADQILEADGLWLSEHSVEVPARKDYFVRRNRLQIGLSCGSIIVEAALRSGSMAQANFCVSEKRPLFAVVPHSPGNPLGLLCEGTSDMVKRLGAIPVKTRDDYPSIVARLEASRKTLHADYEALFAF